MNAIDLEVQGMHCGSCVKHVTQALQPVMGVSAVAVDLQTGHVKVSGDLKQGSGPLISALMAAGFPAALSTSIVSVSSPQKSGGGSCCG